VPNVGVLIVISSTLYINPLKTEFLLNTRNIQDSVRTSQETHYVSATKPNRLMLYRERVAVYCGNHMEHTSTLCGQNAGFWYVKTGGKYSNHSSLEG
jgi:hypothetical protein